MKLLMQPLYYLFFLLLCSSCATIVPVNSYYEKAGTLGAGNIEVAGHITGSSVSHFNRVEHSHDGYGFRAGYGLTDKLDIKIRYERQKFYPAYDERLEQTDYFSIIPKYEFMPKRLSLSLPLGRYGVTYFNEGVTYKREYLSLSPLLLYTLTGKKQTRDLTFGFKTDFIFGDEGNVYLGGIIGAGFSTDLDKWAIRPEIGVSTAGENAIFLNAGIGLQFTLSNFKKK